MIGDILQPTHLLFILVVALLVLGPKRLPEVGRSLGRGIRDFRAAIGSEDDEPHEMQAATPPVEATPTPPVSEPPPPRPGEHEPPPGHVEQTPSTPPTERRA